MGSNAIPTLDEGRYLRAIFLLGPLLEAVVYGIYVCLFAAALPLLVQKKSRSHWPARVFLVGNIILFILVSAHTGVSIYYVTSSFASAINGWGALIAFNNIFRNQIPYMGMFMWAAAVWIADFLMIYRCFSIWHGRYQYWVIALPSLLSLLSATLHSANLYWAHLAPNAQQVDTHGRSWLMLPYVLYFTLNALTTGLVIGRIWSQLQQARRTANRQRLVSVHVPSIVSIIRIMIESAMIYTLAMLVRVVMMWADHPAHYIVYCCQAPITGIALILMALRIHAVRQEARNVPASPSILPMWLTSEKELYESSASRREE